MTTTFEHRALELGEKLPLVYAALSKYAFRHCIPISAFVLNQGYAPFSPFMNFGYFLRDAVDRDAVRLANNSFVAACSEIWVFGAVSDGVLAEVDMAHSQGKPVRYFALGEEPAPGH